MNLLAYYYYHLLKPQFNVEKLKVYYYFFLFLYALATPRVTICHCVFMPSRHIKGAEVLLRSILTLTIDRGEWLASRSAHGLVI
jgi:hypothetical protein